MAPQQKIIETISLDNGVSWVESRHELPFPQRGMNATQQAALWGLLLFLVPFIGLVLYIGLLVLTGALSSNVVRTLAGDGPRGHFSTVWLTIHEVRRADPAGSHQSQWQFHTDQGVKLVSATAYNAWLNAGRPAHIAFAAWQNDAQGGPLHAAEPVVPKLTRAQKWRAAHRHEAAALPATAPGDAGRLPTADLQPSTAHSGLADMLEATVDSRVAAICSFCATRNKPGAHRCEGCYKMLPWDVDAAKAAKRAAPETPQAG